MYNEEVKHRFMRETVASTPYKLKLCESIFNSTEQFEEGWGADLCTRSAEELQPMVNQLAGFRARSKWSSHYGKRTKIKFGFFS